MAGSSQDPTAPHRRRRRAARRAAGPPAQASTAPIADPAADQESPTDPASVPSSGPGAATAAPAAGSTSTGPEALIADPLAAPSVVPTHHPDAVGTADVVHGSPGSAPAGPGHSHAGSPGGGPAHSAAPHRERADRSGSGIRRRAPSIRSVLPGRVGRAIAALTGDHPLEPGVPHRCAPGQRSSPAFRRRSGRRRAGPGDRPAALRPADGPVHRTPPGLAQQARFDRGPRWFG